MDKLIDGKMLQKKFKEELKDKISSDNISLNLTVIEVGNDPASVVYVRNKKRLCEEVGINFNLLKFDSISEDELIKTIDKLNNDDNVNGILVQLPLPKEINEKNVVEAIDPAKDVDGLTTLNVGKLFNGQSGLVPCTALGIIKMLDEEDIDIEGKNVVIIGRSSLVGMPLSGIFLNRNATVTVCHSKTLGLKKIASNADVLVVAIGKKEFITSEYVKDGAVVIDVGINRYDNKLYGDCKFDEIYDKCRLITPVPGGVGPLTVVMLGYNTLRAYYLQKNK